MNGTQPHCSQKSAVAALQLVWSIIPAERIYTRQLKLELAMVDKGLQVETVHR